MTHFSHDRAPGICFPAVRAFIRVMMPRWRSQEEAAAADAGFDGGEWSGRWHAEAAEREADEMAARIAPRFGLTTAMLEAHLLGYAHEQQQHFMESIINKEQGR
jgi:hypothetical protein